MRVNFRVRYPFLLTTRYSYKTEAGEQRAAPARIESSGTCQHVLTFELHLAQFPGPPALICFYNVPRYVLLGSAMRTFMLFQHPTQFSSSPTPLDAADSACSRHTTTEIFDLATLSYRLYWSQEFVLLSRTPAFSGPHHLHDDRLRALLLKASHF